MKTNLIGAGRAGRDVARALVTARQISLQNVVARSFENAQTATRSLGSGTPVRRLAECDAAKLWLLACPDDEIAGVSTDIAKLGHTDALVLHLSGSVSSRIMDQRLRSRASVHPVRSFTGEMEKALERVFCAVEGDCAETVTRLFEECGATVFPIRASTKADYHRACAQASNFVVTLMAQAISTFERCGLNPEIAGSLAAQLVAGTSETVRHHGVEQALTGPIVRGDVGTVLAHLERLGGNEMEAYQALARCTIELAQRSGRLSAEASERLLDALSGDENDPKNERV